jgi:hypothetical protein
MFVILYSWKIKPEFERQFVESWSEVTDYYVKNCDSLGSRLHRGSDGVWYAYAQWKSAEDREKAFQNVPDLPAREKMNQSIEESFPAVYLEVLSDFLILEK